MIYVDAAQEYPPDLIKPGARHDGTSWCHCWSSENDLVELQRFGRSIKLMPGWIQHRHSVILRAPFYHFDLTPSRRRAAIIQGAQEMSLRKWLETRSNSPTVL
jgi:hypothetical protein